MGVLFAFLALAVFYANINMLKPAIQKKEDLLNETIRVNSQVETTKNEISQLEAQINYNGKTIVNLNNEKESYISYIGELAKTNSLKIDKMNVGDITQLSGNISGMTIKVKVDGNLANITSFVTAINNRTDLCRINTMSYRVTGENFDWMQRKIDDEKIISL